MLYFDHFHVYFVLCINIFFFKIFFIFIIKKTVTQQKKNQEVFDLHTHNVKIQENNIVY